MLGKCTAVCIARLAAFRFREVSAFERCPKNCKSFFLNAADYGAYTSRKRFFGIFAKKNLPIVFPEATHSKTGEARGGQCFYLRL